MSMTTSLGLLSGFAAGAVVSLLYFAGLAWGMKRALRSSRPALTLLSSFFFRVAVLLGAGLWLAMHMHPLWAPLGYLLAFFVVRTVVLRCVRPANAQAIAEKRGA